MAVIKLSTPTTALLLPLSPHFTPVLSRHVYGGQPLRTNPKNNTPVGSGPFKFASYKPSTHRYAFAEPTLTRPHERPLLFS